MASDEAEQGRAGVILGREVTPLMHQLVSRLEVKANLSGADQLAVVTALQMAFIAGAKVAGSEPEIEWELPWGDRWANQQGQDGM